MVILCFQSDSLIETIEIEIRDRDFSESNQGRNSKCFAHEMLCIQVSYVHLTFKIKLADKHFTYYEIL